MLWAFRHCACSTIILKWKQEADSVYSVGCDAKSREGRAGEGRYSGHHYRVLQVPPLQNRGRGTHQLLSL